MNKIIITGNLFKEPEMRYTTEGKAIVKIGVANNEGWGDKKQTNFINCVAFGKVAEAIGNYTSKGSKVLIEGKLELSSYTNKEDVKVYTTTIIVNQIEFLDKKSDTSEGFSEASNQETPF